MLTLPKFGGLVLIIFLLTVAVFAQASGLPRFRKSEGYKSVRAKMIKAGWKPFRAKDADACQSGDARCKNRPEMQSCAGTGLANCRFLWKRKGKTVVIFTAGENAVYQGYEFQ
ncbi:MAG TPA: hypothetical protein VF599_24355 [Pyrinomonadaceae bacterium]|jgi:hypothetical protein